MPFKHYKNRSQLEALKNLVASPALANTVDKFFTSAAFRNCEAISTEEARKIYEDWLELYKDDLITLGDKWNDSGLDEYFNAAAEREIALRKQPILPIEFRISSSASSA